MKWFVFGHEVSDPSLGNDIIGIVETHANDLGDARREAQIQFGFSNVSYVTRASHTEMDEWGRTFVVED